MGQVNSTPQEKKAGTTIGPINCPEILYLHYDEGNVATHCTLKITVPLTYARASMDQLRDYFMEQKHIAGDKTTYHLERKSASDASSSSLCGDAMLNDVCQSRDDLYLVSGVPTYREFVATTTTTTSTTTSVTSAQQALVDAAAFKKSLLKCRNYGCGSKRYAEADNTDTSCHHHALPPKFHDTKKGWTCCSEKMVYDWDDFEKIPTCQISRHCEIDPKKRVLSTEAISSSLANVQMVTGAGAMSVMSSPVLPPPAAAAVVNAPVLKSIADFNNANPIKTTVKAVKAKKKTGGTHGWESAL